MAKLEFTNPSIFAEFLKGKFDGKKFSQIESILHENTKTLGAMTSFKIDINAINRWVRNAIYQVVLRQCLLVIFCNQLVKHKDLTKSCILKNEAAVSSLNSVT